MASASIAFSLHAMFGIEFPRFSPSFPIQAYLSRERMEHLRQFQPALLTLLANSYTAHRGDLLNHCELHWAGLGASNCCESCCLAELADPNNIALV